jgi:hypothetical protein
VRFGSGRKTAAQSIRPLLYGDAPLAEWPPAGSALEQEPWAGFVAARDLVQSGDTLGAQDVWRRIATTSGAESRNVLQAWHFLRQSGVDPADDLGSNVLGAVAEVPMGSSHDVLVAYRDGSLRYLNHTGKVVVVEPPAPDELRDAATAWLEVAQQLGEAIGPWEGGLPAVPKRHARVLMLTPSGPRFGQGPFDALQRDPAAGVFLAAATQVLTRLVRRTVG